MKTLKKMTYIFLGIIGLILLGGIVFLYQPKFGKNPSGERLRRIEQLSNYKNGTFNNLSETPLLTSDKNMIEVFYEFLFKKHENVRPDGEIPTIKTDLKSLDINENLLVWLGHSAYYMQLDGKRFLVDPTLVTASPISFFNKAFKGADFYKPEDMPEIDYLIITHDHWDHLDYETIKVIKPRVKQVITGMGVGEHFEYWGFSSGQIKEIYWNEEENFTDGLKITALPARHGSGRGLFSNKTLWSAFMLEIGGKTIYVGGDSGYDNFFHQVAEQFPTIDFAIIEYGQYNKDWANIHFIPEDFEKVVKVLNPKYFLALHNSKYALAYHNWKEPLNNATEFAKRENLNLLTPMIGEILYLDERPQNFKEWWRDIE